MGYLNKLASQTVPPRNFPWAGKIQDVRAIRPFVVKGNLCGSIPGDEFKGFQSLAYEALPSVRPERIARWKRRELFVEFGKDGEVSRLRANEKGNLVNRDPNGKWNYTTLVDNGTVKVGSNSSYIRELQALLAKLKVKDLREGENGPTLDPSAPLADLNLQGLWQAQVEKILAKLTGRGV